MKIEFNCKLIALDDTPCNRIEIVGIWTRVPGKVTGHKVIIKLSLIEIRF